MYGSLGDVLYENARTIDECLALHESMKAHERANNADSLTRRIAAWRKSLRVAVHLSDDYDAKVIGFALTEPPTGAWNMERAHGIGTEAAWDNLYRLMDRFHRSDDPEDDEPMA